MSEHRDYVELVNMLNAVNHMIGYKVYHIKSKTYYRITSFFFKEDDMSLWFEYESLYLIPIKFGRPITELHDGRFKIQ